MRLLRHPGTASDAGTGTQSLLGSVLDPRRLGWCLGRTWSEAREPLLHDYGLPSQRRLIASPGTDIGDEPLPEATIFPPSTGHHDSLQEERNSVISGYAAPHRRAPSQQRQERAKVVGKEIKASVKHARTIPGCCRVRSQFPSPVRGRFTSPVQRSSSLMPLTGACAAGVPAGTPVVPTDMQTRPAAGRHAAVRIAQRSIACLAGQRSDPISDSGVTGPGGARNRSSSRRGTASPRSPAWLR